MRRHFDGVNVGVVFEFVIIELPVRLVWLVQKRTRLLNETWDRCQTFSGKSYILKHEPGGCWTKEKKCLRLISYCLPAACGKCFGSAMRLRVAFGRIGAGG
jgi:hypothetical protein